MTTANTTTPATATAAASSPSIFQEIEATLEADAQSAVNWFRNGSANISALLMKVATGAEVFIEDIDAAAQWVGAHVTLINSTIGGLSALAAIAPPSAQSAVQKMVGDLQTATNDVAGVSQVLTSGNSSGQPGAVTSTVAVINAVNELSKLAATAASSLGGVAGSSAGATQTVVQSNSANA